jgi:hypothetical protein
LEAIRASLPNGTPLELWWQDEARVGQKNKIARRWARRGTRPCAPHDQLRLCARYRRLMAAGKRQTVVTTAIAREMAAFLWAIGHAVEPRPAT